MELVNIPRADFEAIVTREKQLRDSSPEHTLDWYTYDNRVRLLEEVKSKHVVSRNTQSDSLKAEQPKTKKSKAKSQSTKVETVDNEVEGEVAKED